MSEPLSMLNAERPRRAKKKTAEKSGKPNRMAMNCRCTFVYVKKNPYTFNGAHKYHIVNEGNEGRKKIGAERPPIH